MMLFSLRVTFSGFAAWGKCSVSSLPVTTPLHISCCWNQSSDSESCYYDMMLFHLCVLTMCLPPRPSPLFLPITLPHASKSMNIHFMLPIDPSISICPHSLPFCSPFFFPLFPQTISHPFEYIIPPSLSLSLSVSLSLPLYISRSGTSYLYGWHLHA